jgi:hypothetical protein
LIGTKKVATVKRNWEAARRSGLLKFRIPPWFRGFSGSGRLSSDYYSRYSVTTALTKFRGLSTLAPFNTAK